MGDPALFDREAYRCTPTLEARLKEMARTAPRALPPGTVADEDAETMERLRQMALALAAHFGLRFASIEAERHGVVAHYGICYANGVIRIRLRHAATGKLLKESSLVDTLCHELAHLRHFDHSPRFKRFYLKVLDEARRRGWYRPGPRRREAGERQLALF